jgi:hypothetical protein
VVSAITINEKLNFYSWISLGLLAWGPRRLLLFDYDDAGSEPQLTLRILRAQMDFTHAAETVHASAATAGIHA